VKDLVLEMNSSESMRRCDFLDARIVASLVDHHFQSRNNEWWPLWTVLSLMGRYHVNFE
jgi:hypothetical protein